MVRPGWSVRRNISECILEHFAELTTPSAPLRWLRGFYYWRSHPSSQRRGISRLCWFFANQAELAGVRLPRRRENLDCDRDCREQIDKRYTNPHQGARTFLVSER